MNCIAIGRDSLRARILTLHHFYGLRLRHSFRDSEIKRITPRVGAVASSREALRPKRVLMRLRPEAACRLETGFRQVRNGVEAHIKSHPAVVQPDLHRQSQNQGAEYPATAQAALHRVGQSAGRYTSRSAWERLFQGLPLH